MIASLVYTTVCFYSRHTKAVGLKIFADLCLFQENGVFKICERGDCHSTFPSQLKAGSDPDASQPAPSYALQSPRSTSWESRSKILLSRTAQRWRCGPS